MKNKLDIDEPRIQDTKECAGWLFKGSLKRILWIFVSGISSFGADFELVMSSDGWAQKQSQNGEEEKEKKNYKYNLSVTCARLRPNEDLISTPRSNKYVVRIG